jgi:hypothetical protein
MFPFQATAASLLPSLDDVMNFQSCVLAVEFHPSPESDDVQIFPELATAASLLPSLDDVMA